MFLSEYPSRFRKHSLGTLLSLLLLSACSPDNDALPGDDDGNTPSAALRIEVSASDFASAATRAIDNGAATTFESGDRIGIIILDNSGNMLSDNIPYKYNGSAWSFDSSNGEGKTTIYYDTKAATYLAYFPYSQDADNIAGADIIAALKAKFTPRYDQRTKDAYRASDLLVWSSTGGASLKKLNVEFTHAYSSLSLSPSIKCEIEGAEKSYIPSSVADVSFTIGTEPLLAYRADDGSCRIIVSPQTTSACWLCSYKAKTYSGTMPETTLAANNRYTLAPALNIGAYTFTYAQVGDFYCKNNSNEGYLIPNEATLTDAQQADCIGVVYWVGSIIEEDPLLKRDYPGCTHGLVASLQDVSNSKTIWSSSYEDITINWLSSQGDTYGITTLKTEDNMQGYANTKALEGYNASEKATGKNSGYTVLPIGLIQSYADNHPAPASSSDWYFPSVKELKYMCWGQNASGETAGMTKLNEQFAKVSGGTSLQSDNYWSSTESGNDWAWNVRFNDGYVSGSLKYDNSFWLRAVLAF